MVKTGIQLYTLRNLDRTLVEILEIISTTQGIDGVEFAFELFNADLEKVRRTLERTGIEASGVHVNEEQLREDAFVGVVEACETLDLGTVVLSALSPDYFRSTQTVHEGAAYLSEMAERLAEHGLEFLYHNHEQEIAAFDGRTALEILAENTNLVGYEIDVGLTLNGGRDPVELLEALAAIGADVPVIHLTDTKLGSEEHRHYELGAGDVDIDACVRNARQLGSEWFIYEHAQADDPCETLQHGANELARRIDRT